MVNESKTIVQYHNQFTDTWVDFIAVGPVEPSKAYNESKRWFPECPIRVIHRVVDEKVLYSEQ